jgi:hypothetical protein
LSSGINDSRPCNPDLCKANPTTYDLTRIGVYTFTLEGTLTNHTPVMDKVMSLKRDFKVTISSICQDSKIIFPLLKTIEMYVLETKIRTFKEFELLKDTVSESVKNDFPAGSGSTRDLFCGKTVTSLNVNTF